MPDYSKESYAEEDFNRAHAFYRDHHPTVTVVPLAESFAALRREAREEALKGAIRMMEESEGDWDFLAHKLTAAIVNRGKEET